MSDHFSKEAGSGWLTLPRLAVSLLFVLGAGRTARAHDFWIQPSDYRPQIASSVQLALRVGEAFSGQPVVRQQGLIERFVVFGPRGRSKVAGLEGRDPAGFARIDSAGVYVVGYQSRRQPITLEAPRFEKYLAAEGLERILETRRRNGESRLDGREVFSRCAKSIFSTETSGPGSEAIMGCPFELVLEQNPAKLMAGQTLAVRVLYRGRPLEGVQVVALTRRASERRMVARSNAQGRAEFFIEGAGPWLVKAVHMIEAPPDTDADWESFWASLTFEAGTSNATDRAADSDAQTPLRGAARVDGAPIMRVGSGPFTVRDRSGWSRQSFRKKH